MDWKMKIVSAFVIGFLLGALRSIIDGIICGTLLVILLLILGPDIQRQRNIHMTNLLSTIWRFFPLLAFLFGFILLAGLGLLFALMGGAICAWLVYRFKAGQGILSSIFYRLGQYQSDYNYRKPYR